MTAQTIILATRNTGKLQEFLSYSLPYTLITQDDNAYTRDLPTPEETGLTFVENALIKARTVSQASGLPAIADDSGLIVPALQGAPGIYSARFSGIHATDHENRDKLLHDMRSIPISERQAYFCCTIVMLRASHDPMPIITQAQWHGVITHKPCGQNGFGYDSLFYIPSLGCTAAEMSIQEKNQYSHRAQALTQLAQRIVIDTQKNI